MKRGDFISQVRAGVYLYVKDLNKIVKVLRVFPAYSPAYAVWENPDGKEQATFYEKVQIVPEETLTKILEKKKNGEEMSN